MSPAQNRAQRESHIWDTYLQGPVSEFPTNGSTINDSFRDWAVNFVMADQGVSVDETLSATAVDSGGDKGIDGWLTIEPADGEHNLFVFQSKNTRPSYEDLIKTTDALEALYSPTSTIRGTTNAELIGRVVEFEDVLHDDDNVITVSVVLVTSRLASQATRDRAADLDGSTIQLGSRSVPLSVQVVDGQDFADRLIAAEDSPIAWTFTVPNRSYFDLKPEGSFRSVNVAVPAQELAALFNDHDIRLFRLNPRFTLGVRTVTNAKIVDTLTSPTRDHFFHLNNGVTVLCEAVAIESDATTSRFSLSDVQIVNGCQTTSSIYHARYVRGEDLTDVPVNVRIIESGLNQAIARQITVATNDQNPLRAEDSRSNEVINSRLAREFDSLPEPWFYEFKRGMWRFADAAGETARFKTGPFAVRRVALKDLTQAALAFIGKPDDASDRIRFVFEQRQRFREVFVDDVSAIQLLLPTLVYRRAHDKAKQEKEQNQVDYAPNLRFPMVAVVGQVLRWLHPVSEDETYFSTSVSRSLVETESNWVNMLLDTAFQRLKTYMDTHATPSTGVRSIVRRREWMDDVVAQATEMVGARIELERGMEATQGIQPSGGLIAGTPESFIQNR